MAVGATGTSGSTDPTKRYEQLKAEYERLREEASPHGLKEHLLPHDSDGWLIRAMKIGIPAGLGLAAVGGALAGVGRLASSQALQGIGQLAVSGGVAIGAISVAPGLLGPFLQAMPGAFRRDDPTVIAARDAMREARAQTPEYIEQARKYAERHEAGVPASVREHLVAPYDHDRDGTLEIGRPATLLEDERVRDPDGGRIDDVDENAITALPTFRQMDVDGDERVDAREQVRWGEGFDKDDSGRLSHTELQDLKRAIEEFKVDDYRDLDAVAR